MKAMTASRLAGKANWPSGLLMSLHTCRGMRRTPSRRRCNEPRRCRRRMSQHAAPQRPALPSRRTATLSHLGQHFVGCHATGAGELRGLSHTAPQLLRRLRPGMRQVSRTAIHPTLLSPTHHAWCGQQALGWPSCVVWAARRVWCGLPTPRQQVLGWAAAGWVGRWAARRGRGGGGGHLVAGDAVLAAVGGDIQEGFIQAARLKVRVKQPASQPGSQDRV